MSSVIIWKHTCWYHRVLEIDSCDMDVSMMLCATVSGLLGTDKSVQRHLCCFSGVIKFCYQ